MTGDTGDGYYPQPNENNFDCDLCTMMEYAIAKLEDIDLRLKSLEGDYGDTINFDQWYREWDFQPEISFVPPAPAPTKGSGLGIVALFGLLSSIANLVMLTHQDLKQASDCVAMPEHWQLPKEGHRPQLVVQCAEMDEDGKLGSAKYVVTIPHYVLTDELPPPPFDFIRKGRYYGVVKLGDNSKVQVYAESEWEARRVLQQIMFSMDFFYLQDSYIRTGEMSNPHFKEVTVYPKYATYWSKGSHPESEMTRIFWA